jgi:hypothetical protein
MARERKRQDAERKARAKAARVAARQAQDDMPELVEATPPDPQVVIAAEANFDHLSYQINATLKNSNNDFLKDAHKELTSSMKKAFYDYQENNDIEGFKSTIESIRLEFNRECAIVSAYKQLALFQKDYKQLRNDPLAKEAADKIYKSVISAIGEYIEKGDLGKFKESAKSLLSNENQDVKKISKYKQLSVILSSLLAMICALPGVLRSKFSSTPKALPPFFQNSLAKSVDKLGKDIEGLEPEQPAPKQ